MKPLYLFYTPVRDRREKTFFTKGLNKLLYFFSTPVRDRREKTFFTKELNKLLYFFSTPVRDRREKKDRREILLYVLAPVSDR